MSRVVISGIGIISPLGLGREKFWHRLLSGKGPVSRGSGSDSLRHHRRKGFIQDFDETQLLDAKTIKYLQRAERLALISSQLALVDARIDPLLLREMTVGLAIGSLGGNLRAMDAFERQVLSGEACYLDPALVPSGIMNSLSGNVSIRHELRGFHIPVAAGEASSLQAIQFALLELLTKRIDATLAGGVEEIFSVHKLNCSERENQLHSGTRCDCESLEPLFTLKRGAQLCEAAVVLFLESLDRAVQRQAEPYAECAGLGFAYAPSRRGGEEENINSMMKAMRMACEDADVEPGEIDLICVSGSGGHKDYVEVEAIKRFFGIGSTFPSVFCMKSILGESLGASGALQVAASALFIRHLSIPLSLIFNRASAKPQNGGDAPGTQRVEKVLINSFSSAGNKSCLVLKKI